MEEWGGIGGINIQCLIGATPAVLICPTCVRALLICRSIHPTFFYIATLLHCTTLLICPSIPSTSLQKSVCSLLKAVFWRGKARGSKGRTGGRHSLLVLAYIVLGCTMQDEGHSILDVVLWYCGTGTMTHTAVHEGI